MADDCETPKIAYPCRWEFKTIGPDEYAMRVAIQEILAEEELEFSLERSNTSRTGKYCSMILALVVRDEEHRNGIFVALSNHPAVRVVL